MSDEVPQVEGFEVVGRFHVWGVPGRVMCHEADQYLPDAWAVKNGYESKMAPQLFSSWEGIDSDLPEGEYFVVRRR